MYVYAPALEAAEPSVHSLAAGLGSRIRQIFVPVEPCTPVSINLYEPCVLYMGRA
jgi:hypothetical protein